MLTTLRMWLSLAKYMAVLITASLLSSAQTAVVKIHVLDFKTNRPLKHHRIGLLLPCVVEGDWPHNVVKKRTRSDGIAVFGKVDRHSIDLCVVENNMEVRFSTSEVLEHGAVAYSYDPYTNPRLSWPVVTQPGELVVYTRRYNPWQKLKGFFSDLFCFCP
jgi:hypothetical protein